MPLINLVIFCGFTFPHSNSHIHALVTLPVHNGVDPPIVIAISAARALVQVEHLRQEPLLQVSSCFCVFNSVFILSYYLQDTDGGVEQARARKPGVRLRVRLAKMRRELEVCLEIQGSQDSVSHPAPV